MKKSRITVLFISLLIVCFTLCGCMSQAAQDVDDKIIELSKKAVEIDTKKYIDEIHTLDSALSEKEHDSLRHYAEFEAVEEKYNDLVQGMANEIEELITALPSTTEIRLASEEQILAARDALEDSPDQVRELVSNKSVLDKAIARMEQVKKECWVECETCGGKGYVKCKKCKGTGTWVVKYHAPNGRVMDVYSACSRTQTCTYCNGEGGTYIEQNP